MSEQPSHIPAAKRARQTLFAAGALIAAIAATTLTACGPRDETPLAGGANAVTPQTTTVGQPVPQAQPAVPAQAVPQTQTQAAAVAPAPAYAPPPPVVVAQAGPMPPATYAAPAQQVPAAAPSYPADPPRVQPAPDYRPAAPAVQVPSGQLGSIASIEPIRKRPQGTGTGAVIGGVLGAVVGNQFGHGLGRAAMTGVGAAGGAIAGNNVERNYKTAVVGYRVTVRLDNGHTRTFQRSSIGNLHVGERVRVDANGLRHA
jgi:outer membrane lipoprotein SlyB